MSKKVFTNGEEAYVAMDMAELRAYLTGPEVGLGDDDVGPDSDWTEQTGEIGITLEERDAEHERHNATREEPGNYPGEVRIFKPASAWAEGFTDGPGLLWTTNT